MKNIVRRQSCQNFSQKPQPCQDDDQTVQNQDESRVEQEKSLSPNDHIKKRKKTVPNNNLLANLSDTKYVVVRNVLKKQLGFKMTKDVAVQDWDLFWTDNVVVPEQLSRMKPHQKINHFPGMFTLSRKNYLARNLNKMAKMFSVQYNFYPKTWVLPSQLSQLRAYMEEETNPVVIAKPEASSQGKGIFLTKSIEDFQFGQHYVVQKYLKKPLILEGLKFDLRVYVLVAGCDPLRVYIYKEGLARFATQEYAPPKKENLSNLFMHLTNYSINKNSQNFVFNESHTDMDKGHKRSLTSIANNLGDNWEKVWSGTKDIIVKTLISTQPILKHHYRSCQPENYANNMCFEILGFDIIIDSKFNPMLLEVNYTPSFSIDTPLDKFIKQNLIKESLTIMNLSSKAKSEVLTVKKKQMMERTLTGKKIWYSKEERQKVVDKAQKKRDQWQNAHLGNFQKIYPVNSHEPEKQQQYQQFIAHSQQCYENITGANIRRNQKIQKPASTKDIPSSFNLTTQKAETTGSLQNVQMAPHREGLKLTNTEHLQRIYKAPIKPMLPRKKRETVSNKTEAGTITSMKSMAKRNPVVDNKQYQLPPKLSSVKMRPNSAAKKSGISKIYNITFKGKQ